MRIIDTHTHLYVEQFDGDRREVVNKALDEGVDRMYLPNIDSSSINSMLSLEASFPDHCIAMMGLHPCSVKDNYKEELRLVKEWLDKRPFAAVGEIGIDLYWDKTFFEQQKDAFLTQIQWAKDLNLPIVIHSREATDIIIALLQEVNDDKLRGIFHCFTGNAAQAQRIIDLDFYLGIGGVLTFKKAGLDKTMEQVGLEYVVLETDSPYLAPSPYRGKRNESAYVKRVLEKLADIKAVSVEEVAMLTTSNALKIFQ